MRKAWEVWDRKMTRSVLKRSLQSHWGDRYVEQQTDDGMGVEFLDLKDGTVRTEHPNMRLVEQTRREQRPRMEKTLARRLAELKGYRWVVEWELGTRKVVYFISSHSRIFPGKNWSGRSASTALTARGRCVGLRMKRHETLPHHCSWPFVACESATPALPSVNPKGSPSDQKQPERSKEHAIPCSPPPPAPGASPPFSPPAPAATRAAAALISVSDLEYSIEDAQSSAVAVAKDPTRAKVSQSLDPNESTGKARTEICTTVLKSTMTAAASASAAHPKTVSIVSSKKSGIVQLKQKPPKIAAGTAMRRASPWAPGKMPSSAPTRHAAKSAKPRVAAAMSTVAVNLIFPTKRSRTAEMAIDPRQPLSVCDTSVHGVCGEGNASVSCVVSRACTRSVLSLLSPCCPILFEQRAPFYLLSLCSQRTYHPHPQVVGMVCCHESREVEREKRRPTLKDTQWEAHRGAERPKPRQGFGAPRCLLILLEKGEIGFCGHDDSFLLAAAVVGVVVGVGVVLVSTLASGRRGGRDRAIARVIAAARYWSATTPDPEQRRGRR